MTLIRAATAVASRSRSSINAITAVSTHQRRWLLVASKQKQNHHHPHSSYLQISSRFLSSATTTTTTTTTTPLQAHRGDGGHHQQQQQHWRAQRVLGSRHQFAACFSSLNDRNLSQKKDTNIGNDSSISPLMSMFYDLLWSKSKIPKGFDDYFPPNNRAGKTLEETSEENEKAREEERLSSKDDDSKQQKQQEQKSGGGSTPPPEDDDMMSRHGLLALLALIVLLRTSMERQAKDLGQEITFQEFRRDFLWKGRVEKIVVINSSTAKVVLKKNGHHGGHETAADASSNNNNITEEESLTLDNAGSGTSLTMEDSSNNHYFFYIGSVESLEEKLTKAQQQVHPQDWVEVQYVTRTSFVGEFFKHLPLIAFTAAMYFGMRHVTGGSSLMGGAGSGKGGAGGGAFSIGRSPAKKIKKEDVNVNFGDVAGCTQAKMEIMEFVDFLKDSTRFTKLGAKIPKGALLCGPPGTGKTLLAKAVAGESGVPFYSISGSEFLEMFVGVGPSRVRDLFKEARQNTPCIIFIDEIDAVGRKRGRGGFGGGGNDERENTLNQLLVEMDGFSPTSGIVVLAGTNRVDILDQALTRPGRFDRQITVDRPDLQGRKEIFQVHLRGIKLDQKEAEHDTSNDGETKVDSDNDEKPPTAIEDYYAGRLAGLTPGFAGADIANICNEAAIVAARRKADAVAMEDFDKATDRIIGGLESNKILSKEEQSIVAHHEAGHAVAGWFLEHADPLLKVTIIPRASGALGFAQYLPKEVFLRSRDQIMDIVCMALAGRAAEEVFFGQVTTGASDDLRRVTQLVYSMIKDYGMNNSVGQLSFPSQNENNLGDKPYSDSTAEAMDEEARNIVNDAYERTVALIREHKNDVDRVANLLLDKETITHDDMIDLIGERPFQRDAAYEEYVRRKRPPSEAETDSPLEENDTTAGTTGPTPVLA